MSSWGATPLGASAGRASAAQAEPAAPVRGRIASGQSLVLPAPARLLPLLPTVDSLKTGLGIRDSRLVQAVLPAFTNPAYLHPAPHPVGKVASVSLSVNFIGRRNY